MTECAEVLQSADMTVNGVLPATDTCGEIRYVRSA